MALTRWPPRLVAALHFGYLAYLLGGGYLAWRYPRTLPAHMVSAGWAVVVAATPLPCPLTTTQNRLRAAAGLQPLPGTFLASYVEGRCYPRGRERHARAVAATAVLLSWLGCLRGRGAANLPE